MTFAVAPASPARADEAAYLQQLQPKYVFLSAQQLLDAGHKVCAAVGNTGSGMISADTVNMIQKDMAVSVAVANDIVATAVVVLPC
ncbi:MAG: DUF732 domain-containing protein [Mycobacteriaceae bacterium]|nr:DUF732 domain-containing protein [Mycobacteriaceae bacterium]MBV9514427.1 DUF732 domain-containing protein [Mycobacteriaceae bacterium]